jgi:hypothetical protein
MKVTDGMEFLEVGIWWGHCPKIGEDALVIHAAHRLSEWKFDACVARTIRKHVARSADVWFQCVRNGEWEWLHGIVDQDGTIKQVG